MWNAIRSVIACCFLLFVGVGSALPASAEDLGDVIDREAKAIEGQMIEWRRDIHQHPELGNREVRTSALVAEHLKNSGSLIGSCFIKGQRAPLKFQISSNRRLPVSVSTSIPCAPFRA